MTTDDLVPPPQWGCSLTTPTPPPRISTYPPEGAGASAGAEEAAEAAGGAVLPGVGAIGGQGAAAVRGQLGARDAGVPQELRHVLPPPARSLCGDSRWCPQGVSTTRGQPQGAASWPCSPPRLAAAVPLGRARGGDGGGAETPAQRSPAARPASRADGAVPAAGSGPRVPPPVPCRGAQSCALRGPPARSAGARTDLRTCIPAARGPPRPLLAPAERGAAAQRIPRGPSAPSPAPPAQACCSELEL